MQSSNPEVVHARERVDGAEGGVVQAERAVTLRLLANLDGGSEQDHLRTLNDKLHESRAKLEDAEKQGIRLSASPGAV